MSDNTDTKWSGGDGNTNRCAPATLQQDLKGRTYAVTGGNGGVGFAACMQLAKQGAQVIMMSRTAANAEKAIAEIKEGNAGPGADIDFLILDLSDLVSVRACAEALINKYSRLDGLLNNAGIMNVPEGKTKDGFERQFGTNHIGHVLLTHLLLPLLKTSAPSRVVCTSSVGHQEVIVGAGGHIDFDDLNFVTREYSPWNAYAQSKLANLLHAKHLSKIMQDENVEVTCVSNHPGFVGSGMTGAQGGDDPKGPLYPRDGAQSALHCLLDPDVPNHPGAYFAQTQFFATDKSVQNGGFPIASTNPEANDPAVAERLYSVSLKLITDALAARDSESPTSV